MFQRATKTKSPAPGSGNYYPSWDHPTVPPNARSVAVANAADRTEGDIIIEGVGEDSGESEWWVAGVGDGCVEWGVGRLSA